MPLPGPFWGPILAGAAGAATAAVPGWLIASGSQAMAGWERIRPGAMHWTGLVLSAALAALIGYVVCFVGSSRADGATQMQIAGWMALAFASGTVLSLLHMRRIVRAGIGWRDSTVRFRASDGAVIERPITAIRSLRQNGTGWFEAAFADGTLLRIDPYAKGADALLQSIFDISGKGRTTKF